MLTHDYSSVAALRSCSKGLSDVGTGKTRAVMEYARWIAESYPACRILFVRQTRVSMTESVLVTWEQQVLGQGHAAIHGTASRSTRHSYRFPNGSEVILGGMDNPDRILSTEYDLICICEAAEVSVESLEKLGTRLRNYKVPWQQIVCDTNPRGEYHWINLRARKGTMTRLRSRHWMNPAFYEMSGSWTEMGRDYLTRVARGLSGARFLQLFKGQWASEVGLIYPMFDPATHIVKGYTQRDDMGRLWLCLRGQDPIEIMWSIASVDWGYTNPGTMQVWGVDADKTMYMLAEIYRKEKSQEWWADRVVEFREEYKIRRVVCDPAEPDRIDMFNDRLGTPGGREEARIVTKANNSILTGVGHTQALLAPTPDGKRGPKIYLLADALRMRREPELDASGKPCCLHEEMCQYFWDENEEGKPIRERPDPTCADHAADAMRYAAMWVWRKDLTPKPPAIEIPLGSMAHILGHREKLERIALRRQE